MDERQQFTFQCWHNSKLQREETDWCGDDENSIRNEWKKLKKKKEKISSSLPRISPLLRKP